jgi:hypothetical protein
MTALERYIRLEAIGAWREAPEAPPREVVVSFGKATLVLTDPSDVALAHWALAALRVVGERDGTTVYAVDPRSGETLTIADPEMVAAIAEVTRELPAWPSGSVPRRRRGRFLAPLILLAGLVAAALFVPAMLRGLAVSMVPPEQATELGDRVLLALMEQGGAICAGPPGQRVLERIAVVAARPAPRIRVLDLGGGGPAMLPGGTVVLDRVAVTSATGADALARMIAAAVATDPLAGFMRATGPLANLRHIFTGDPGPEAIARAAAAVRATPVPSAEAPVPGVLPLAPQEAVALISICD